MKVHHEVLITMVDINGRPATILARHLQRLHVHTDSIDGVSALLRLIPPATLEGLHTLVRAQVTVAAIQQLFTALSESQSRLETFKLHVTGVRDDRLDARLFSIPTELLTPLLKLTQLTVVDLGPIAVDDRTLRILLRAFPRLVELRLNGSSCSTSLGVLSYVAFDRPTLETLDVSLTIEGFSTLIPPIIAPALSGSVSRMTALKLGYSEIDNPLTVAMYLSHLFPLLQDIETRWSGGVDSDADEDEDEEPSEDDIQYSRWTEVFDLVRMIAGVRAEERAWADQCRSDSTNEKSTGQQKEHLESTMPAIRAAFVRKER